jgi:hypothetical protein
MPYPPLHRKGANVLKTKARDWADLFADVRKGASILIEGYERREQKDGVRFVKARNPLEDNRRLYADRYIVIVETPTAESRTMKVREVAYAGPLPTPCNETGGEKTCSYVWASAVFDAFPLFGLSAVDYESEVTDGITDATENPPSDSTILRCFRNHDAWIVDKVEAGGSAVIPVRVLAAVPLAGETTATATHLQVQPVKAQNNDTDEVTTYVNDGEPELARTWPYYFGRHYLTSIGITPPVIHSMVMIDGVPYVQQTLRMATTTPSTSYPSGGCPII